jgi:hypothetical protein
MNYRKIVQIAVSADTVYALAGDGTVWWLHAENDWRVLPRLPEPVDRLPLKDHPARAQPLDPGAP